MARTYTISGAHITVGGDPFEEGRDDFLEWDLVDEAAEEIAAAAVTAITATLRSLDTGAVVNGRSAQDVKGEHGGTLTNGTFRLDLTGSGDLVAVGTRALQRRQLTVIVTHSEGKQLPIVVDFELRTYPDVG